MIDVTKFPPQQVSAGGPRAGPGRAEDHDDADRPDRGLPLHRDPLHGHHRPPRPLHEVSARAANEPLAKFSQSRRRPIIIRDRWL